ncbi:MAG: hypothetical protein QM705_00420 [Ancrocorticia sp.]
MLVVVIAVGGVLVSIVDVVHVVAMLNSLVAAILAVGVLVNGVLSNCLMLVVVIAMQCMVMGSVDVVHVVAVLNSFMAAAFAVGVLVNGVLCVNVSGAHDYSFYLEAAYLEVLPPSQFVSGAWSASSGSRTWVSASSTT